MRLSRWKPTSWKLKSSRCVLSYSSLLTPASVACSMNTALEGLVKVITCSMYIGIDIWIMVAKPKAVWIVTAVLNCACSSLLPWVLASFPCTEEGEEKRAPGTHCLCMRLTATEFRGDQVITCMYVSGGVINLLRRDASSSVMCSSCSVWVSFILHYSMSSGNSIPRDKAQEQVASNECVYQGNMPLCSYPPILVSPFLLWPTRHFSGKVGRACSSNVHSVLRTKLVTWTIDRHISTRP